MAQRQLSVLWWNDIGAIQSQYKQPPPQPQNPTNNRIQIHISKAALWTATSSLIGYHHVQGVDKTAS